MGTEAEQDLEPITSEENEIEEVEAEEVETDEIESDAEGDEEIEETQPQKTFTQQELNEIVQKRLAKLNKKKGDEPESDYEKRLREAEEKANTAEERSKLFQLAMEQARKGSQQSSDAAPDPDKFDGGEYDPEYRKQYEAYLLKKSEGHVQQLLSKERENDQRQRQQEAQARELETAQRAHYERANTLEVKDYETAEDKVIEALGSEAANVIIQSFEDSHALMYHLGKNPEKLQRLDDLVKSGTSTSTAKALAELGRISASLAVNSKSKPAPNPVDKLEGSTPGASADEAKINAAWKQYEKGAISMQQYIERKRQVTGSK